MKFSPREDRQFFLTLQLYKGHHSLINATHLREGKMDPKAISLETQRKIYFIEGTRGPLHVDGVRTKPWVTQPRNHLPVSLHIFARRIELEPRE